MPNINDYLSSTDFIAPRNNLETQLTKIFEKVLGVDRVGIQDNFFELGGNSLLIIRLLVLIQQHFTQEISIAQLYGNPTIEELGIILTSPRKEILSSPLVPIKPDGFKQPFFCVPGITGNPSYMDDLSRHFDPERPFYVFEGLGLNGKSEPHKRIEDMASYYIEAMKTVQIQGPYLLGGHSFGGWIAFEMAQQLQKQGEKVGVLAILDSMDHVSAQQSMETNIDWDDATWLSLFASYLEKHLGKNLEISYEFLKHFELDEQLRYCKEQLQKANFLSPESDETLVRGFLNVGKASERAIRNYLPQDIYPTLITLFRASEDNMVETFEEKLVKLSQGLTLGWDKFSNGSVTIHWVPGDHYTMMKTPYVKVLAKQLSASLDQIESVNNL